MKQVLDLDIISTQDYHNCMIKKFYLYTKNYLFILLLQSRLPEIPKYLEIENGWELSLLHFHLCKFKVYELPTQSFWRISVNFGASLGYQRLNGLLYLIDACEEENKASFTSTLWKNIWLVKLISACILLQFSYLLYSFYTKRRETSALRSAKFDEIVEPDLSLDLYDIRDTKGKY